VTAALVPIVVTDDLGQPDGSEPPNGTVQFVLTESIISPQPCAAKVVGCTRVAGAIAQQLVANDKDSSGSPISPATTMYRVVDNTDGAAEEDFFITVPAVPPGSRVVSDGVLAAGSNLLTSATAAFTGADLGAYVLVDNGTVLPPGTIISEVVSSSEVQLSRTASANLTGLTVMVGASASLSELRPAE
jgi:hypothetical protein